LQNNGAGKKLQRLIGNTKSKIKNFDRAGSVTTTNQNENEE
jgi:hypothetical protein